MNAASLASRSPHVVVVGAGAFGGWTALELIRRGARVTLIDAWGPGNARASSGGETRVIRATYGTQTIYSRLAVRALARWREHDRQFGTKLLRLTGVLWMFQQATPFAAASIEAVRALDQPIDELSASARRRRFPQIDFAGVEWAFLEPEAGYLFARRACEHVVERVIAEGGQYLPAAVASPVRFGKAGPKIALLDRSSLSADAFVFACGPWLGTLFPDIVGRRITPTRQDVFYVGTPAGDRRFADDGLPIWIDVGRRIMYGIPGNAHRGFKIADDTSGARFDPTAGSREPDRANWRRARRFLARRFPALARAPLLGSEVCQYEATPDSDYIVDRHPGAPNVWIVGGGSGHGFKMGPVIGEMVASAVLGTGAPDPAFSLARFGTSGTRADQKWT
jgi:glycine/D-amino acid oxidase-like deaminating enzyme